MGPRGDAIAQMDWVVGDILKDLREKDMLNNTLIIFTSDNGPVLDDGYMDQAEELIGNHDPTGGFRGGKYSAYEAGTRVPTIVYWKNKIAPSESNALITQIDLLSTLASIVGTQPSKDVIDSQNQQDAWLGQDSLGRSHMIEESFTLSYRKGYWKYIAPFEGTTPDWLVNKKIENGLLPNSQLFNLKDDPQELKNLANEDPELVMGLRNELILITKKDNYTD